MISVRNENGNLEQVGKYPIQCLGACIEVDAFVQKWFKFLKVMPGIRKKNNFGKYLFVTESKGRTSWFK